MQPYESALQRLKGFNIPVKIVTLIFLVLGVLVMAGMTRLRKSGSRRFQDWKGWQKVLGVLAILMAVMIVLTPEFALLGFIGDTAFFDMLVLALSLQLQGQWARLGHMLKAGLTSGLRWLFRPRLGFSYLLSMLTLMMVSVVGAVQRVIQRWTS